MKFALMWLMNLAGSLQDGWQLSEARVTKLVYVWKSFSFVKAERFDTVGSGAAAIG